MSSTKDRISSWIKRLLPFPSPTSSQSRSPHDTDGFRIVDHLTLSVLMIDTAGHITYVSPYTEVLTGYSVTEVTNAGKEFLQSIMHPEYHDRFERSLQFFAAGEPYQYQHRFTHKSGVEVWAETRTSPIRSTDHGAGGLLMVTLNISQQIVYQRQVEVRTQEVEDFTFMVSHDLKAPLFTIRGMLGLFTEEEPRLTDNGREIVLYLHKAVDRLDGLIGSVLTYAKITATNVAIGAVDPKKVIQDLEIEFAPLFMEHSIEFNVAPDLPLVEAESIRLAQVFSNLITNSIKYRDLERPLCIEIGALPSRSHRQVTLYVRDTACGIPADKLESVFRPFHRNHGSDIEGSGIGLACVKKILEKFGGSVELTSEVGQGSTFLLTFRLPPTLRMASS